MDRGKFLDNIAIISIVVIYSLVLIMVIMMGNIPRDVEPSVRDTNIRNIMFLFIGVLAIYALLMLLISEHLQKEIYREYSGVIIMEGWMEALGKGERYEFIDCKFTKLDDLPEGEIEAINKYIYSRQEDLKEMVQMSLERAQSLPEREIKETRQLKNEVEDD